MNESESVKSNVMHCNRKEEGEKDGMRSFMKSTKTGIFSSGQSEIKPVSQSVQRKNPDRTDMISSSFILSAPLPLSICRSS